MWYGPLRILSLLLTEVHMSGVLGMLTRALLALDHHAADITPDGKCLCISVVPSLHQPSAKLLGCRKNAGVLDVEHLSAHFCFLFLVVRLLCFVAINHYDDVVVDTGVNQDDPPPGIAAGLSVVETFDPSAFHVKNTDFYSEPDAENGKLYSTTPGVWRCDPSAVIIWRLVVEDRFGVFGGIGLDG